MSKSNYYHVDTPNEFVSIVSLWILKGSNMDPIGKRGLSHCVEHLFLNQTKDLNTKIEVLRKIDRSGLFYNAFTRKNCIYFYLIQENKNLNLATSILLEAFSNFKVEKEVLEREKEIIYNEQNQFFNNSQIYVWNLIDKVFWPNSALDDSGLGSVNSIQNFSIKDVEEQKELLFDKKNLGFITISSKRLDENIEKKISKLTEMSEENFFKTVVNTTNCKIICEHRNTNTIFLTLGFLLPPLDEIKKEKVVIDFIRNYLVSGWSSILIERLRLEKNYTYWVHGGTEFFFEGGYLKISFAISKKFLKESMLIIIEELNKLCFIDIANDQLKGHKNAMKAHIIKNYIRPENTLWWFGWNVFIAKQKITLADYFNKIDLITSTQIKECALKFFSEKKIYIAAIGDISNSDFDFIFK